MRALDRAGEEARLRNRLAELMDQGPLLRGTLTLRRRRCGKPRCRCARGELHASWYLIRTTSGKLRQVSIPRSWEPWIREASDRYREALGLIERLSEVAWRHLEAAKRRPKRDRGTGAGW